MAPKRAAAAAPSPATTANKPLSSGPAVLSANSSIVQIVQHIWQQYLATTPQQTMLLDAFMGFLVLVGGVQFVYCVVAGNFPFNAFLSGFSAAVGQFVLTASLRMQTSNGTTKENNKSSSKGKNAKSEASEGDSTSISHERAFADFIFGSLILHFFCINFIN